MGDNDFMNFFNKNHFNLKTFYTFFVKDVLIKKRRKKMEIKSD